MKRSLALDTTKFGERTFREPRVHRQDLQVPQFDVDSCLRTISADVEDATFELYVLDIKLEMISALQLQMHAHVFGRNDEREEFFVISKF